MVKKTGGQFTDRELKRAIGRALRRVEKMYREEPHQVIISAEGGNSVGTKTEIAAWLFHRR